jgi:hypothetical protein
MAREQGLSLTGPDGLLKQLTKAVIETAVAEEMTEHLGHANMVSRSAATSASASGPRRCALMRPGTWRSRCRRIGPVPSNLRSCSSGSAGFPGSMRSCCRCTRKA